MQVRRHAWYLHSFQGLFILALVTQRSPGITHGWSWDYSYKSQRDHNLWFVCYNYINKWRYMGKVMLTISVCSTKVNQTVIVECEWGGCLIGLAELNRFFELSNYCHSHDWFDFLQCGRTMFRRCVHICSDEDFKQPKKSTNLVSFVKFYLM